ncbi:hypothetical protein [uncultured Pelagimonas sp.]|uniref:hypothetical protein n=1 Tax=uncultured Pelagimonas sp. TaxID=1618102 RepID=UPI002602897B|nr:hypothetical protein [uncultured Pelagimonas sp.]
MEHEYQRIAISQFREEAGKRLKWVEEQGGHLWLTRHGKHVAAVIPFYQLKMLEALLGKVETQKANELEREYSRWRAAKSVQAAEELARLTAGQSVGGEDRTDRVLDQAARGRDPWADDPVLITTQPWKFSKRFKVERE